jgi:hypothetical protein
VRSLAAGVCAKPLASRQASINLRRGTLRPEHLDGLETARTSASYHFHSGMNRRWCGVPAAILKVAHFQESQISGEVIHCWDGAFAIPSGWFARGLRDFSGPPKGRSGNIAMADFGLAAFALFFMQSASFLAFQRTLEKGQGRSNCQTLLRRPARPANLRRRQYSSASMTVITRTVTTGSVGSGDRYFRFRSK